MTYLTPIEVFYCLFEVWLFGSGLSTLATAGFILKLHLNDAIFIDVLVGKIALNAMNQSQSSIKT